MGFEGDRVAKVENGMRARERLSNQAKIVVASGITDCISTWWQNL